MKQTIYILLFFSLFSIGIFAQKKPPREVKTWRVSELLATPIDSLLPDTVHRNFQDDNLIDRFSIANSYNGNMLSPIQSKIYFDRPETSDFLFSDAYFPYIQTVENSIFYNTKTPFSILTYTSSGTQYRWEEQIKFLFTANANKKLNFGAAIDYIISHGEYQQQETQRFNTSLFGTFDGRRYKATGVLMLNNLSNYDNGGIADIKYITDPEETDIPTQNIPINMQNVAYSRYTNNTFFYNHQYCLGFEKEVKVSEDSSRFDYIPVTRFIHTLKLNEAQKRYYEPTTDTLFYQNTFFHNKKSTNDTAAVRTVSNTFAIHLEEEFNRFMQFGLTAYISNDIEQFTFLNDTVLEHNLLSNTRIGGILSKTRGRIFRYNAQAELGVIGYKAGNFLLRGDISGYFRLWNDSVVLRANGFMRLDEPTYFLQNYHSQHFRWNNDFTPIYRTRIGGTFEIPTRQLSLNVSVENVLKHIYFNESAMPVQNNSNIQILAADLKSKLNLTKWFAWENNIVYQLSSQPDVLPLPALAIFSNLYYNGVWFKVLDVQGGVNLHYHTAYFAPDYMPATGRFFAQRHTKIGNYPFVNAYANFKIYQTRVFVEYTHVNQLIWQAGNYFSMPLYPLNPAVLKFGIAINFYN